MTPAISTDGAGFGVIIHHTGSLVRFAKRLVGSTETAEDIVQEALLRAYANRLVRAKRNARLHKTDTDSELKNTVYKITRNLAIDHLRKKRLKLVDSSTLEAKADNALTPAEQNDIEIMREAVRTAISELPKNYREVIALRFGHGYSHRECARTLNIGIKALESRLHRAKLMLKTSLKIWTNH